MKLEWVTDNVKRGMLAWWEQNGAYEMHRQLLDDINRHKTMTEDEALTWSGKTMGLQEAIDLLRFAGEKTQVLVRIDWRTVVSSRRDEEGHPLKVRTEEAYWVSGTDVESGEGVFGFGPGNSESLLHAVLLAIDAIVAHKPEAFT